MQILEDSVCPSLFASFHLRLMRVSLAMFCDFRGKLLPWQIILNLF